MTGSAAAAAVELHLRRLDLRAPGRGRLARVRRPVPARRRPRSRPFGKPPAGSSPTSASAAARPSGRPRTGSGADDPTAGSSLDPRRAGRRRRPPRPGRARRARDGDRQRPPVCRGAATDDPADHRRTGRRARAPLAAGRSGGRLRARRLRAVSLVARDDRRPGAGRGGRVGDRREPRRCAGQRRAPCCSAPPASSASTRCWSPAASRRSARSRTGCRTRASEPATSSSAPAAHGSPPPRWSSSATSRSTSPPAHRRASSSPTRTPIPSPSPPTSSPRPSTASTPLPCS